MTKLLINNGVDINIRNGMGETVMHVAAARWTDACSSKSRLIRHWSNSGADLNAQRHDGRTALHIATKECSLETVKVLCECGVDVNVQDSTGATALHCAAWLPSDVPQRIGLIRILVLAGTDLNAQDLEGNTPLHVAANIRSLPGERMPPVWGNSLDAPSATRDTALHVAIRAACSAIDPMLAENGKLVESQDDWSPPVPISVSRAERLETQGRERSLTRRPAESSLISRR
jgi:hypothetical protein